MAIRRFLLTSAVSLSLSAILLPAVARAEEVPGSTDVETGKHSFIGVIKGNSVFVRSSPREDAYPTMKLDKGQKVTVVGIKLKWLKILPPEGSFAYVPKAYVNVRSNGKVARATREVIAKVGSSLNQLKTAPMAKIDEGQDVEILGEQDEYFKVKPPEGTFLYVNETFVEPEAVVPTVAEQKSHPAIAKAEVGNAAAPTGPTTRPVNSGLANEGNSEIVKTETPQVIPGTATVAIPATTQPSEAVASATDSFNALESDFKIANEKSITEQPIDSLLNGYGDLLKLGSLSPRQRQIGEVRVSTLKLRAQAKAEFVASREALVQAADRQKALVAEHDEIQQRIKEKQVTFYAAIGTLRASSIQNGVGTLYRLTDPASGRTVAYIRTDDAKYTTMLNQFVGVKGTVVTDNALNMKIVEHPTTAEPVDPTKVNDTIAAQIIPPSLMARVPTARVSD